MSNHQWSDVEPKAIGQWQDILGTITQLTEREMSGKHGPCPACGGKDRFRFDNNIESPGDGGYVCGQCGSGNGISLLMKCTGMGFSEAVNSVGEFLNLQPVEIHQRNQKNIVTHKAVSYSKEDPEKAQKAIDASVHAPMCELTLRHGVGPDGMLLYKGKTIICPITNFHGDTVNAAAISLDESVTYAAGGLTYGAATVVGNDTGRSVIICRDWFDAWRINLATGCQVLCAWSELNFRHVAEQFKKEKPMFVACHVDDDIASAESAGLKILLPNEPHKTFAVDGHFKGIQRKVFCPTEYLDQLEDKLNNGN